jgi:transposase InsO family protein
MDERLRFVVEYKDGLTTMTALCDSYGISRETGYTWLARFDREGPAGLVDRSRRPHHSPRATPDHVVQALLEARRRHPTWGPKKLLGRGWRLPERPALSTASALLKRHGLSGSAPRRRRPGHPGRPTTPIAEPNGVWTIDFKGQFRTGDGTWCYPLTLVDAFSRYLLACRILASVRTAPTRAVLERVFREFGLPARIRSDNGAPFASAWALARLSPLAVWWIRLGITPERIEPGRPAQNGRHERFHRTLKRETARPPAATRDAQQRRFGRFRREYNEQRPHEALCQRPPADFYVPSARPYPKTLPPMEYPADMIVRRVGPSGSMAWHGERVSVSHTLIGQDLGLTEIDDGRWRVQFGSLLLGHFDERRWRIDPIAAASAGALAGSAGSRPVVKNANKLSTMSPD